MPDPLPLLTLATLPYNGAVPSRAALALTSLPASPTTHPVAAAAARMLPTSRRSFINQVQRAARLLTGGRGDAWSLPWGSLRYENMLALRQALVDLGLAPASVNNIRNAVRAVALQAWRLGQLAGDELQRIQDVPAVRSRVEAGAGRMLDRGELAQLVRSCQGDGLLGARDLAIIALLYGAALRRAEVVQLVLADLQPAGVRVVGKGNTVTLQPLPVQARRLLRPWLRWRGTAPGPLLFPVDRFARIGRRRLNADTVYQALVRRRRAAGLRQHFTPHDLRRTFGSQLLDRGVELRVVQQLLRHASITTTMRYDRRQLRQLGRAAGRLPL